ncbi:hypothetical protein LWF15_17160 [Kineosporia rhizophila]|uniref:hypothetical protein n=1 Tax=Kineosporia TaxID=49184 RepID=UPI001E5711A2|nr:MULTISPECIES: hypothetical protein [Kineosporia]MCE0537233.1 hypothetical protein [Kineosporia rhizophila]GLY15919.1 hypothetical protein Kisp01_29340 [Kineosporia sp. NBRC 101677]
MNFENPIATLFPGAAGRTVSELARRHARGESQVEVLVAARSAAVVPDQFVKVATRLALLGLVDFPVTEKVTLVRENIVWPALYDLADQGARLDALLRDVAATCPPVTRIAIAGPVAAGTARTFPERLEVALIAPDGTVGAEQCDEIAAHLSRALGNACLVTVAEDELAAAGTLSPQGFRIV